MTKAWLPLLAVLVLAPDPASACNEDGYKVLHSGDRIPTATCQAKLFAHAFRREARLRGAMQVLCFGFRIAFGSCVLLAFAHEARFGVSMQVLRCRLSLASFGRCGSRKGCHGQKYQRRFHVFTPMPIRVGARRTGMFRPTAAGPSMMTRPAAPTTNLAIG